MTFRKSLSVLLATSLAMGSTAAVAANGSADSIRQPAAVSEAENMAGGFGLGWIIALVVAAGVALVIIEDDEDPVSP